MTTTTEKIAEAIRVRDELQRAFNEARTSAASRSLDESLTFAQGKLSALIHLRGEEIRGRLTGYTNDTDRQVVAERIAWREQVEPGAARIAFDNDGAVPAAIAIAAMVDFDRAVSDDHDPDRECPSCGADTLGNDPHAAECPVQRVDDTATAWRQDELTNSEAVAALRVIRDRFVAGEELQLPVWQLGLVESIDTVLDEIRDEIVDRDLGHLIRQTVVQLPDGLGEVGVEVDGDEIIVRFRSAAADVWSAPIEGGR